MNTINTFFLYARKSRKIRKGQHAQDYKSIKDQLSELRELACREGLEIVDEMTENFSARRPGRPVFNAMLDRIEKG